MSKSVALSKEHRDTIISKLIKASKQQTKVDIANHAVHKISEEIRDVSLGKHKEAYLSLPVGMQAVRTSIEVSGVPGRDYSSFYFGAQLACPKRTVLYSDLPKSLQRRMGVATEKLQSEKRHLNDLREKVYAIVYGCNTTKQLLDLLPEAEEHFPLQLKSKMQSAGLPAIPDKYLRDLRKELAA